MSENNHHASDHSPADALASLLAAKPNPTLDETHLRLFWELHILHKPKGRQPPTAVFDLGALNGRVLAKLRSRHTAWIGVPNRLLWPTDVATHWEPSRRASLHLVIDDLPRHIREAYDAAPGNKGDPWRNPLLLTRAPNGMYVPVAVMPGNQGILIRSLITPVASHKMRRLEKLAR